LDSTYCTCAVPTPGRGGPMTLPAEDAYPTWFEKRSQDIVLDGG
jgi:hypothetical protein